MTPEHVAALARTSDWSGVRVAVAGFGVSGYAAADNLTFLGARVVALDDMSPEHPSAGTRAEQGALLESLGATVRLGPGSTATLPADVDLLVASPGFGPRTPLMVQAAERGLPVWGEVELAWRLRDPERPAPWLAVTGTGAPAVARMLEAMLRQSGRRAVAAGDVGLALTEIVMDPDPYDVLAVALSPFQLHGVRTAHAQSAAVLDVGDDPAATGRVYDGVARACVYDVADPATEELVREAEVVEGARAIGVTLGTPAVGMVGLVDDVLCDRAFIEERQTSAAELCTLSDLATDEPRFVRHALTAAALARSHDVAPDAIRAALRGFPAPLT